MFCAKIGSFCPILADVPFLSKWTNEPNLVLRIDLEENVAVVM